MRRSIMLTVLLTALFAGGLSAQPVLEVRRTVVQWPDVHVFYDIRCGGVFQPYHSGANIALTEDGLPITSFMQNCPDTTVHCPPSAALVFDMSAGSGSLWTIASERGAHAFIDKMNGGSDEAAILFYDQTVTTVVPMTTQKNALYGAFSNLRPGGATALYDAAYEGVSHVLTAGGNPCRTVVVTADGADNASSKTADDVIDYARSNFVRVITVGLGAAFDPAPLQRIADSTGGRFFAVTDSILMRQTYREIFELISDGFRECELVYQADCPDGAYHELMMTVSGVCSGGSRDSIDVLHPAIPTNQYDLEIVGPRNRVVEAGSTIDVQFINNSRFTGQQVLQPFDLAVGFNKTHLRLLGLEIPQASPLQATTVNMIPFATNYLISSKDAVFTGPVGPFFTLQFEVLDRQDSVFTNIFSPIARTLKGCLDLDFQGGSLVIVVPPRPVIEALGSASLCPGDSVILRTTEEFDSYKWTTGDTTRAIVVKNDGAYAVQVMDYAGRTAVSPAFIVDVFPGAAPKLTASDTLSLCAGRDAEIGTTESFRRYQWSTGDTTATITVTDAGSYYVRAVDANGCTGISDTLVVVLDDPTVRVTPAGPVTLCENDTLMLEASEGFASYRWSHGVSGRIAPVTQGGRYAVMATNLAGCTVWSDTITVNALPAPQAVITTQGPPIICPGDSLLLEGPDGFAAYTWSTGATTRRIRVRDAGIYWLKVTGGNGCVSRPATIQVDVSPRPVLSPAGVHAICFGETLAIDAGGNFASYLWSNGDTTRVIQAGETGDYWVDVTDAAGCVIRSDTVALVVRPELRPEIEVDGDRAICEGDSVMLSAPLGYRGYYWSSGETTSRIAVRRAGSYTVTVFTNEGCDGTSDPVDITVRPRPALPVITRQGSLLTSSPADAYQWYRDGVALAGETRREHDAKLNGRYTVKVFNAEGCGRMSDPVEVIVSSVRSFAQEFRVEAWPDPNDGQVTVAVTMPSSAALRITVSNILGQKVAELREQQVQGRVTRRVDITHAPRGVYLLRVEAGRSVSTKRIIRR